MTKKTRIAFTSCVRFEAFSEQPQWDDIATEDPDYLFLLGDQIYMDYGFRFFSKEWNGKPKEYDPNEFRSIMDCKYEQQWNEPHFKAIFEKMRAKDAVFGVWDDHDFSWNNSKGAEEREYPETKTIARKLFNKWVYGKENDDDIFRVVDTPHARIIFLDVRYYAEEPKENNSKLLGENQWAFVENALNHELPYTIICSGITMTHGEENWQQYKSEYARLRNLVKKENAKENKRVLFLAGDIHKNRFCPPAVNTEEGRPCYEIASSGLAVNYFGVWMPFDDVHNWGLMDLDEKGVEVKLVSKWNSKKYRIDYDSWESDSDL